MTSKNKDIAINSPFETDLAHSLGQNLNLRSQQNLFLQHQFQVYTGGLLFYTGFTELSANYSKFCSQQKFSSGGAFSTSRVSIFLFILASIMRFTQRNKNKPGGEGGLFGTSLASVQRLVASARRFHGIGCNYSKCHLNQKFFRRSIFHGEIKMWYKVFATHFLMIKFQDHNTIVFRRQSTE